jgi:Fe-S cluster biosynthesis and repair protein YggX
MKLMIGLITDKLKQYPNLVTQITERGGLAFLDKSTHTMGTGRWSSKNPKNMFMNALKQAYQNVSATPTVTAKPTTQTLESKTELEVYIPDYSLAESVYNNLKSRESKGEDFIKIKNELYKKFYDNISQKYDQIPKDTNFNIRYMLGNTVIESANIENEESIKKTLVYDNIPLGNDDRSKQINSILNGLLYINAFVLYQKFGKINKQFLPPKLVAKIMVRETIEQANISEDELNKVLEVIRNC